MKKTEFDRTFYLKALIKRLLSLFEPLIIVLLGLGVGSVVTIMFMAIMDMQGAAG